MSLDHIFTICFYQTTDTLEYIRATRASGANYYYSSIWLYSFHVLSACLGAESVIFVSNIVGLFYLSLFDFRIVVKPMTQYAERILSAIANTQPFHHVIRSPSPHAWSLVGTYAIDAMRCPQCLFKFVKCVHVM